MGPVNKGYKVAERKRYQKFFMLKISYNFRCFFGNAPMCAFVVGRGSAVQNVCCVVEYEVYISYCPVPMGRLNCKQNPLLQGW